MSRLATSFVLGYHGCDASLAAEVIAGKAALRHSRQKHDWLGAGAYFWESDPVRALEWAHECSQRPKATIKRPAIVGAVIDLGNCLDLTSRDDHALLRGAYEALRDFLAVVEVEVPENRPARGMRAEDVHLRFRDCAVVNFLHSQMDGQKKSFDTTRAPFIEGDPSYDGAGFYSKTHVQIAVRNLDCIKGYFYPPGYSPKNVRAPGLL